MPEPTADLRYLEARSVRCPAGDLAGFRVCSEDAHPLGTVSGVLIRPSARRLEYLVLDAPGLLVPRRYLLPLDAGAVVHHEPRILKVSARKDDLRLETFAPRAVPPLSGEDLATMPAVPDAA